MIVGCYTLDLYCDTPGCRMGRCFYTGDSTTPPFQTTAETGAECRTKARRAGWRLDLKNGLARCPKCQKAESVS